jgi:outer membrane protein OmpA-like peptidoglycan-associated protein
MGLSLKDDDTREPARRQGSGSLVALLAGFLALLLFGIGYLGYEVLRRTRAMERQMAVLAAETRAGAVESREALKRAMQAEAAAHAAAAGRQAAEAITATAQEEAEAARHEASSAKDEAARAKAEADRVRKQAEAEMNRLDEALSQIADTQRTALGLVMKLGSDYLKFEFDKAELRTEDRELLSRVAGILLTSQDYTVSVNGHTDDQGSAEYNQKLSERRAQAVRDYLVKAGLPAEIVSVTGHGKSLPVVPGSSEEARAKNRRVELAIANTRIRYGPAAR